MSKSKATIEWCSFPGTSGEARLNGWWGCYGPHGDPGEPKPCSYCYAERIARRLGSNVGQPERPDHFKPTWHDETFKKQARAVLTSQTPKTVFIQSMGDLWDEHIPSIWRKRLLRFALGHGKGTLRWRHVYVTLTKMWRRPASLSLLAAEDWPANWVIGFTVTTWKEFSEGLLALYLLDLGNAKKLLNCEPWLDSRHFDDVPACGLPDMIDSIRRHAIDDLRRIDWIIVGAKTPATQKTAQYIPAMEDICEMACVAEVPLFVKPPAYDAIGAADSVSFRPPLAWQEWPAVEVMYG